MGYERTKVMLDPSLFLRPRALERTWSRIPALREEAGYEFFVSATVRTTPRDVRASDAPSYFGAAPDSLRPRDAADRLAEVGVRDWGRPPWAVHEFAGLYRALGQRTESSWIQDLLFDEWFFLTHESWLLSRVKRPFKALVAAGETGVEFLNPIVRKTLKQDTSYVVQTADRLRALAKWMAVGGAPAAALINPILGAVGSGVAGGFLLLDPPAEG